MTIFDIQGIKKQASTEYFFCIDVIKSCDEFKNGFSSFSIYHLIIQHEYYTHALGNIH